jgi:hypothetical protein
VGEYRQCDEEKKIDKKTREIEKTGQCGQCFFGPDLPASLPLAGIVCGPISLQRPPMALELCACHSVSGALGGMGWSWCRGGRIGGPENEAKGDVRGAGYEPKQGGGHRRVGSGADPVRISPSSCAGSRAEN